MRLDTKKDMIIGNGFFILLIIIYLLLHAGPLNLLVLLTGLILLNLTILIIK